ncbi:Endocytosis protein [Venturia inaequalis]|uniref:Uncharacterized protein n=1 Tax=Venturia inaequalis TaxID=5025 RepID=A0A8H3UQQ7_VENIN|nr:hypothetical protein EG327_008487 [Venturia inaequalis]RDI89493.1 Endocytosis protein [Venturia inaequalis]
MLYIPQERIAIIVILSIILLACCALIVRLHRQGQRTSRNRTSSMEEGSRGRYAMNRTPDTPTTDRVPQRHAMEPHTGGRQRGDTVGSDQGLMWHEQGVNFERGSSERSEFVGLKNHMSITDEEVQKMTAINFNVGRGIGDEGGWRRSSAADIFQHVPKFGIGHRRGNSLQRVESP